MAKRKLSYKKLKSENSNRKVTLWSGKPAPFTVTPPKPFTEAGWLERVKENEKIKSKKM